MLETGQLPKTDNASNARREGRETAVGQVAIDGKDYPLINWSASGFMAQGFTGGFAKGDRMPIDFSIELNGEEYFFACKAFIVWSSKDSGSFAGAFVEMDQGDRLALAQYFE